MIYAVTNETGVTTYDLTYVDAMAIYTSNSRLWKSENNGENYEEVYP